MWRLSDIRFEMIDDLSEGSLVTLEISTPIGTMLVMGSAMVAGRVITADGVHIHGVDVASGAFGPGALRVIADALLERMNCDELVVQGAVRTSGARPGARPRPLRFARRPRPETDPEAL